MTRLVVARCFAAATSMLLFTADIALTRYAWQERFGHDPLTSACLVVAVLALFRLVWVSAGSLRHLTADTVGVAPRSSVRRTGVTSNAEGSAASPSLTKRPARGTLHAERPWAVRAAGVFLALATLVVGAESAHAAPAGPDSGVFGRPTLASAMPASALPGFSPLTGGTTPANPTDAGPTSFGPSFTPITDGPDPLPTEADVMAAVTAAGPSDGSKAPQEPSSLAEADTPSHKADVRSDADLSPTFSPLSAPLMVSPQHMHLEQTASGRSGTAQALVSHSLGEQHHHDTTRTNRSRVVGAAASAATHSVVPIPGWTPAPPVACELIVGQCADQPGEPYVVKRGDSLWTIVSAHENPQAPAAVIATRLQAWVAANPQLGDPNDLRAGDLLTRPA